VVGSVPMELWLQVPALGEEVVLAYGWREGFVAYYVCLPYFIYLMTPSTQ
jgi:hypothetical protein